MSRDDAAMSRWVRDGSRDRGETAGRLGEIFSGDGWASSDDGWTSRVGG